MPDAAPGGSFPKCSSTAGHVAMCCLASGLALFSHEAQAELVLSGIGVWTDPATIVHLPLKERENSWYDKTAVRTGPISIRAVEEAYRLLGVDLGEIVSAHRLEIPRLAFAMVPGDLSEPMTAVRRKRIFVGLLLPAVLAVNEALSAERARLESVAWQLEISDSEARWLQDLGASYGCEPAPLALLERVDVIPTPIALAQAALESGWGRSRFARSGNALFGKRTSVAHRGIRPRASSEQVFIERFSHVLDAVASYAFILNSGAKFHDFRKRRGEMRRAGVALDSSELVATLAGYSERGGAYVKDLEAVMAGFVGLSDARFAASSANSAAADGPADLIVDIDNAPITRLLPDILAPACPSCGPLAASFSRQARGHLPANRDVPVALAESPEYLP